MKAFKDHPASVGETYLQHMRMSLSFGVRMFFASFACFLHAVFPFLFVKTGSATIQTLHRQMVSHRSRLPQTDTRMGDRVDA